MKTDKNKDTWCVNAFYGMSGNNDGTTKLCCMYKANKDDDSLVLGIDSIESHFNNKIFQIVREDLDNGIKNTRCNYCWQEEAAGRKSKRIRDNEKYYNRNISYSGLSYLELNLGNTCNLACRTCNPYISSGWMKEAYDTDHTIKKVTYKEFATQFKKFHRSYDEDSVFWIELEEQLSNIKQFDFYGGEPFMSKKMWELLKTAQQKGVSKDIELHYNTNGTHYPIKVLPVWKDFKEVNISFSIDGIGDKFEFMRYPAKWSEVNNNMKKFIQLASEYKNINLNWCITISAANVYDVPEILDYYYKNYHSYGVSMYLNLVHGPAHYNIGILPARIKQAVEEKLMAVPTYMIEAWTHIPGIINFMNQSESNNDEFKKFLEVTRKSDNYRNQSFKDTFSEYYTYFV
jgi:MoaA/NifB/PqqE/SkfB family radical SAM enzyme